MNWSITEMTALVTKAARGVGAPPAQAARFGQAAAHLLCEEGDSFAVENALNRYPDGPILIYPLEADHVIQEAHQNGPVILSAEQTEPLFVSYLKTSPFAARIESDDKGRSLLRIDRDGKMPAAQAVRIAGCAALVPRLEALAARTYVPESEQSRLSGAGAGLNDND